MDEYTAATAGDTQDCLREFASDPVEGFEAILAEVGNPRYPGAFSSEEPTPYEKSAESGSIIEQDLGRNVDGLYGMRMPHYALKHEKFEHRIVIFLKAQGLSNKEIADKTGYTPVSISNIVRQPWAQTRIIEEMHKAGRDEVQTMLRGAMADSVARLIEERDNPNARASERITAADKLLDRFYGKPNQPITQRSDLEKMSDAELSKIASSETFTATT